MKTQLTDDTGFLLPPGEGQDEGKKERYSLLGALTLPLSLWERELQCTRHFKLRPEVRLTRQCPYTRKSAWQAYWTEERQAEVMFAVGSFILSSLFFWFVLD